MEIRELSVVRDADEIARHLGFLYSELFGSSAVLSDADFHAAVGQCGSGTAVPTGRSRSWTTRTAASFTLAESFAFFAHASGGGDHG
jgi:hypothetical protein